MKIRQALARDIRPSDTLVHLSSYWLVLSAKHRHYRAGLYKGQVRCEIRAREFVTGMLLRAQIVSFNFAMDRPVVLEEDRDTPEMVIAIEYRAKEELLVVYPDNLATRDALDEIGTLSEEAFTWDLGDRQDAQRCREVAMKFAQKLADAVEGRVIKIGY